MRHLLGGSFAVAAPPRPSLVFKFSPKHFVAAIYTRSAEDGTTRKPADVTTVRAAALLPQSRHLTIALGGMLLAALERMLPRSLHRQLALTSTLMGVLDVVLDEAACGGEAAVLRVSSLILQPTPASLLLGEHPVSALAAAARRDETARQAGYWENVLQPGVGLNLGQITHRTARPVGIVLHIPS